MPTVRSRSTLWEDRIMSEQKEHGGGINITNNY